MKKLLGIVVMGLMWCNLSLADIYSRFGELSEIRDVKMRGKDNQWVRPHPGPFVWNKIEKIARKFFME